MEGLKEALNNHLILGRILSFLPKKDLKGIRSVCRSWANAALPLLSACTRLDPPSLLLAHPENLIQRFQFIGGLGTLRLFLSNLSFPFPQINGPDELNLRLHHSYRKLNSTKPLVFFHQELLPHISQNLETLLLETVLVSEEDAEMLAELLRPLSNLRALALVLVTVEELAFKKFVQLFEDEKLLPKLSRFSPRFAIPDLHQSDPPPWGLENLARFYACLGNQLKIMDIHGWNGSDLWNCYDTKIYMDPVTTDSKLILLPKLDTVRTDFGESQFLLKLPHPLSRLYLSHWGGKEELSLLIGILKRFSSTLQLVDISWTLDLRKERRGLREPLPALPSLKILSINIFSFENISGQPPPVDNLSDEFWRKQFTPEMMDPFYVKERLFRQGSCHFPKLEKLCLIYAHLQGKEIWDYFFTFPFPIQRPLMLKKLVISRVKDVSDKSWETFQNDVKGVFPKLEKFRFLKLRKHSSDHISYWPVETFLRDDGRGIEWEDKHLTQKVFWPDMCGNILPMFIHFILRNNEFLSAFQEINGWR